MPTATGAQVRIRPTISLEEPAYAHYEQTAKSKHRELDEVFSERLNACVHHEAQKPIYLSDHDRRAVEEALGENLNTASDLTGSIRRLVKMKVGKTDIMLKPDLLDRLHSRCPDYDFARWLSKQVVEDLERFALMR